MDSLRESLTRAATEQGFVLVGFARLRPLSEHEDFYRQWLADGERFGETDCGYPGPEWPPVVSA